MSTERGKLQARCKELKLNPCNETNEKLRVKISEAERAELISHGKPRSPKPKSPAKKTNVVPTSSNKPLSPKTKSPAKNTNVVPTSSNKPLSPKSTSPAKTTNVVPTSSNKPLSPKSTSPAKTTNVLPMSSNKPLSPKPKSPAKNDNVLPTSSNKAISPKSKSSTKTTNVVPPSPNKAISPKSSVLPTSSNDGANSQEGLWHRNVKFRPFKDDEKIGYYVRGYKNRLIKFDGIYEDEEKAINAAYDFYDTEAKSGAGNQSIFSTKLKKEGIISDGTTTVSLVVYDNKRYDKLRTLVSEYEVSHDTARAALIAKELYDSGIPIAGKDAWSIMEIAVSTSEEEDSPLLKQFINDTRFYSLYGELLLDLVSRHHTKGLSLALNEKYFKRSKAITPYEINLIFEKAFSEPIDVQTIKILHESGLFSMIPEDNLRKAILSLPDDKILIIYTKIFILTPLDLNVMMRQNPSLVRKILLDDTVPKTDITEEVRQKYLYSSSKH